jgi:hypothetical protein
MITWITPAGSLGLVSERLPVNIPLSATSDLGDITLTIISGTLPRGLRLAEGVILGSPVELKVYTESRFVIRASDGVDLEDRTFSIGVDGSDAPFWLTREGFLNVGPAQAYFVLDNAYIDFQLEASDQDLSAGDILEFYLVPNGGQLPPGLSLSIDGVISGFTDPIFALEYLPYPWGGYDTTPLDIVPLDFVEARSNGFDTFLYDNVDYDYNEPSYIPRRLSRVYNFVVAVTDGISTENRLFKIYVVTEEFLKSDNSIVQVDTNLFQADSSSNRTPIWITESNLGKFRANNYVTLFLDVYNPPSLTGTITFFLLATNPGTYRLTSTKEIIYTGLYEVSGRLPNFRFVQQGNWTNSLEYNVGDYVFYNTKFWVCQATNTAITPGSDSYYWNQNFISSTQTFNPQHTNTWEVIVPETTATVPPGLELDNISGDLSGKVPYQPRISRIYSFTLRAVNFPSSLAYTQYTFKYDWSSVVNYSINDAVIYNGIIYICIAANRDRLPVDIDFWTPGVSFTDKTFTVEIVGEIESAVEWITDSDLGTIKPNQPSRQFVEGKTLLSGGRIGYEWVSGKLPPGLTFYPTGLIEGKVKQFADDAGVGLTRFFERLDNNGLNSSTEDSSLMYKNFDVIFDSTSTSFDKKFTFTIKLRDSVNFATVEKTFFLTVIADTTKTFANLYIKAFQEKSKRLEWYDFITNTTIFKPSDTYRYGDSNFGVQPSLQVLVFAGIESTQAVTYVQAMSRNHYRKRLKFGNAKVAKGKDEITQETLYELIYVEVIDDLEKDGKSISSTVELPDNINSKVLISYDSIKIDSNIPLVSDSDHQRVFPNSIKNMRSRIRTVGDRDREFLPLWMRSIQDQASYELGYTKALPLCYCVPGKSAEMLSRIKASGFDFKSIDFVADRYIIDIIDGMIEDKYLAFPQRGEKLP